MYNSNSMKNCITISRDSLYNCGAWLCFAGLVSALVSCAFWTPGTPAPAVVVCAVSLSLFVCVASLAVVVVVGMIDPEI